METTLSLLGCILALAQPTGREEWLLLPRLGRGQELVYRGTYAEEMLGRGVQFNRTYRVEARAFVLDAPATGLDVAFFTVIRPPAAGQGDDQPPSSVRLELAKIDLEGKITPGRGVSLAVPLEGPPTAEWAAFVEVPRGRVSHGQVWTEDERGRPSRVWKVIGNDIVSGTSCVRLEGVQQTDDWDQPRADRVAWRRQDVVWVLPKLGVAFRVERTVERREPARTEPTQRAVTKFELESTLQYPGQLYEDRRREILQAKAFHEAALPLLPNPVKHGPKPFEAILTRISRHLDAQPPTPYREAIVQFRRRVESASRGETPAAAPTEEVASGPTVATVGHKAPEFVTTNLLTSQSHRLGQYAGRPVLLLFYSPASSTAEEVLRFAQGTADFYKVAVLALSVADDAVRVRRQCDELRLTLPVLSGKDLRSAFAVEATPKLIVLDAAGMVRASYDGWGDETPSVVRGAIKRCLQR